mmetsp:Transcript_26843/g.48498  ORF Transcript_26843/g.48498 Transcript_26843/m.48498 type:complete len:335 (-) Transcript_26843:182-1186(-)
MPQRFSNRVLPQRSQKKQQPTYPVLQQVRPQHSAESFHKTKLCKFFMEGRCARGPECKFAHSEDQLCEQPDLYRTRLCSAYLRGGRCPRGAECRFAHSEEQLRRPSQTNSEASDRDQSIGEAPEFDPELDYQADAEAISETYPEDVSSYMNECGIQWVLCPMAPSWNPWSVVPDGIPGDLAWDPMGEEEEPLAWDPIGDQLTWDPIGNGKDGDSIEDSSKQTPPHHPDCLAGLAALSQRYASSDEKRWRPPELNDVEHLKTADRKRLDSTTSTQLPSQASSDMQSDEEDRMMDFAPVVKNTFLHFEAEQVSEILPLAKCRSEPLLKAREILCAA